MKSSLSKKVIQAQLTVLFLDSFILLHSGLFALYLTMKNVYLESARPG